MSRLLTSVIAVLLLLTTFPAAQESALKGYDELLDLNVRDGLVYYRVLVMQRGRLDQFVQSLAGASVASMSENDQKAFWINAYNAIVLQTVIDHYPIVKRSDDYPAKSIRQIPGAFERLTHRVAGRMLTLDQIEQTVLSGFHDPRVYLALGRGALSSGRLRSEAYTGARVEAQLAEAVKECVTRAQCADIDRNGSKVRMNAVFSWREADFTAAYASKAPAAFTNRSPIERAGLAFLDPTLLASERTALAKNGFTFEFMPFDWTLNDLGDR